MKLKYSTSLLTPLLYINILILHIALIHSQLPDKSRETNNYNNNNNNNNNHDNNNYGQNHHNNGGGSIVTTDNDAHENDNTNDYYPISEESKKIIIEKVKANLLKVLGLKEAPKKPENKAYVPQAMLESYRSIRESVRETIPDDRDFYGKIQIDDLDNSNHEDFWSAVYNKFGTYDIEVDMSEKDNYNMHYQNIDARQLAYFKPIGDPENISPVMEHTLLPINTNQQFVSVHLKYNLTRGDYVEQLTVNDIKKAELHLFRENIRECQSRSCHRKPVPFFNQNKISSNNTNINQQESQTTVNRTFINNNNNNNNVENITQNSLPHLNDRSRNTPRFQKVYILQVLGYDSHDGHFMTRVHEHQRVNTMETSTLRFDISKIIKDWLLEPKKNYGIIVRVTNDDKEFNRLNMPESKDESKYLSNASTYAGSDDKESQIINHIRIKRDFRETSESDEVWMKKIPSILIYSDAPEVARRHVKREGNVDKVDSSTDSEHMQADEPDSNSNVNFSQSNQTNDYKQNGSQNINNTNKPTAASTRSLGRPRSNNPASNRRDVKPNSAQNRGSTPTNRQPSVNPSNHSQKNKKGRTPRTDKCSRKPLSINFDEVGWSNWIIAPQAYYADYCSGDCSFPMSDHQNATNHAIIQGIYHAVGRLVPRTCCVPVKLGKMAILYQIDGGVQMKHYDDMIVESCGCL